MLSGPYESTAREPIANKCTLQAPAKVSVGFWNFLGAGVFGFLMLSIGIALFCLRYIIPQTLWPDKAVRISFWSLNLGLEWMVFATLFPLGILPLYHSISVSYYDARTLNYIGSRANSILEWMRMPGDIVFIVGGALPILYLTFMGVRYMRGGTTTEEPKDILFTDIVVPSQAVQGQER